MSYRFPATREIQESDKWSWQTPQKDLSGLLFPPPVSQSNCLTTKSWRERIGRGTLGIKSLWSQESVHVHPSSSSLYLPLTASVCAADGLSLLDEAVVDAWMFADWHLRVCMCVNVCTCICMRVHIDEKKRRSADTHTTAQTCWRNEAGRRQLLLGPTESGESTDPWAKRACARGEENVHVS